jgi:sulfofructose kinase
MKNLRHMDKIELLGIGFCAVDYVGIVPFIPIDSKVEIRNLKEQCGGASATAIFTASKLGSNAGFIGKVGDDAHGRRIIEDFKKENIDISGILIEKNATSAVTFVWIEEKTGKRSIAWNLGSKKPLKPEELTETGIRSIKVIHLDGHENQAAIRAIKIAKNNGIKVSLDGGSMTPNIDKIIEYTDFLIVSEEFAKKFTGMQKKENYLKKLMENEPDMVIVTHGKDGYYGYIGDKYIEKGSFEVDVVDTTGAGDVFHGAFLYGYIKNMGLEKSLEFASAVAALKCTKFGVRSAIPSYKQAMNLIKKHREK